MSVASVLKKSDSRITAAKSAIEAAAMTSWPNIVERLSESLSTGMRTPSDVELSTTAMNTGERTKPAASRAKPAVSATAKDTA